MTNPVDSITENLNREQLEAVTAPSDRHYLILAGAGCGKTTVLTRRIAYLASNGTPISSILALTFTRKAAEEMAVRVEKLTEGKLPNGKPTISTFHAFALRILSAEYDGKSNFIRIGFGKIPRCPDEKSRLVMLSNCCSSEERNRLGVDLYRLDAMIERLNVFPESILQKLPVTEAELLLEIAARFREQKRRENVWDFSDLIEGAVKLFEVYPAVMEYYRSLYREILVDEFQDTNPLQIRLLLQLLGNDKKLFAVGDDDQAIYGFRGADVRTILSFTERFKGAEIIKLQSNYRSVPAILSKANRIFKNKAPEYRKVLVPGKYFNEKWPKPSVHYFIDQTAMAEWIVAQSLACSAALGLPANLMAALFRMNMTADWVENYFERIGIKEEERPQLLTVHKSKGLEFPVVFLCDMEETVFPSYRERGGGRLWKIGDLLRFLVEYRDRAIDCDWDEEKRLFYVAVTRAQLRLFFLSTRKKEVYGRCRRLRPSKFLRLIR